MARQTTTMFWAKQIDQCTNNLMAITTVTLVGQHWACVVLFHKYFFSSHCSRVHHRRQKSLPILYCIFSYDMITDRTVAVITDRSREIVHNFYFISFVLLPLLLVHVKQSTMTINISDQCNMRTERSQYTNIIWINSHYSANENE